MSTTIPNFSKEFPVVMVPSDVGRNSQPSFALRLGTTQSFRAIEPGETKKPEVSEIAPMEMVGFSGETALENAAAACSDFEKRQGSCLVVLATGVSMIRDISGDDLSGMDFSLNGNTPCIIVAVDETGRLLRCVIITGLGAFAEAWNQLIQVGGELRARGYVYLLSVERVRTASGIVINFDRMPWVWDTRSYLTVRVGENNSWVWDFYGKNCKIEAFQKAHDLTHYDVSPGDFLVVCASVYRRVLPVDETEMPPAFAKGFFHVVFHTGAEKIALWYFHGQNAGAEAAKKAYAITQDRVDGVVTMGIVMFGYQEPIISDDENL